MRTITLLLLALCTGLLSIHAAEAQQKPNVLLIILEDWGPYLHCYGEEEMFTPNLDQLAAEGVRYNRCFSSAPVCSVGRSSLMVGVSQYTTRTEQHRTGNKKPLPAGIQSIMGRFVDAGYFTALGCGYSKKIDLNFSFDTALYQGKDWKERKPGQPFYAHLTLMQTHRSWKGDKQRPIDPAKVTIPPWYPDTPLTRKDWALGIESAQTSDRDIGTIVKRLKDEGIYENTIIVITADHGIALPRGKQFLYDEGLHIPLIIRWPARIKAGTVSDELVSNLDIVPTIFDLAGLARPDYLQGRSLVDPKQTEPNYIFAGRDKMDDTHDAIRIVRSHDFKYMLNLMPERPYCQYNAYKEKSYPGLAVMNVLHIQGKLPPEQDAFMQPNKPKEELYDLKKDPHELHNLAESPTYAATLNELREQMERWRTRVGDRGVTNAFRSGGWPATYPTRPLTDWMQIQSLWEAHILHDGASPTIPDAPGFAKETKAKD
jgi:N-sulfoglucosamine sulfohydrolase